jgi:hypothetical protein
MWRLLTPLMIALPWLNPFAPGPMPSAVPFLFAWACIAVLLGMGTVLAQSPVRSAHFIGGAWVAAASLSCAIGLLQYFGQTQALGHWVNGTMVGEAFGNLRQRNQFATLASIGLVALLWWVGQASSSGRQTDSAPLPRIAVWLVWAACALLLAAGNAASGSRTGLFQWGLVAVLLVVWHHRMHHRARIVGFAALALYVLSIQVLPWLLETMTGFQSAGLLGRFREENGCASRRVLWANVLHLVIQKPWMGWGWGELGYAHFMALYPGERFCDILDNAHNLPLHLAVELGVPFSVVVCCLLVWLVWRAKPWREANPARQLAWGVLGMLALHSMVEYPLWYGPFQMAAGLSLALLWHLPAHIADEPGGAESNKDVAQNVPLARLPYEIIAIIIAACLAFAAWDYWRVSQLYVLPQERALAYQEHTLDKVRGTRLFRNQVEFAELTTATLTPDNAEYFYAVASRLLHFSAEPRVAEKLIESARILGRHEAVQLYNTRYQLAFAQAHAAWQASAASQKAP